MVRWPGKIKPGGSNDIVAHLDWLPTFVAMAGDTQIKDELLKGYKVGDRTYKVHLDGDNLVPYLTGQAPKTRGIVPHQRRPASDRPLRQLELAFMEQRAGPSIWQPVHNTYYDWLLDHAFLMVPAQDYVGQFLLSFKDYPQRQKAASFNLDEVMEKLKEGGGSK